MAQILAGFPQQPADTQAVTLADEADIAGTVYQFRFVFRQRTLSWYVDIALQDGTPILQGRRLSPGWPLNLAQFENGPAGSLICMGTDDFVRSDLGQSNLRVAYFTPAEIAALNVPRTDGIAQIVVT